MERGIAFTASIPERVSLDRDRAVLAYRVAREALVNATKHSGASAVDIQIRQSGELTQITVRMTARASIPTARREGHFGLRILKDTVQQAGGNPPHPFGPGPGNIRYGHVPAAAPAVRWAGQTLPGSTATAP